MKIDAEVHFWKWDKSNSNHFIPNNKLFHQHYLPEQLKQSLDRNEIGGCIAVVSEKSELETRFLAELSVTHPEIKGVVGWTDLHHPKSLEKIEELRQYDSLRGFLFELSESAVPAQDVMELLQSFQFSLDIPLSAAADAPAWNRLMESWPEQSFILQNAGNPDTREAPKKEWETAIREMAQHQNLSCKVSGLLTGGIDSKSWKPAGFYPFLEILFDAFGPDRLLYASDWPFLLVSGIYVQWKSLLEKFMEKFTSDDLNKFFGGNAARLYRI